MEHIHRITPFGVAARAIRRRMRLPLKITGAVIGITVLAMLIVGFRPFDALRSRHERGTSADQVMVKGTVESMVLQSVGSPFSGTVAAMAVREGQKVNRGDLLFRMDTRPLQQELATARENRTAAWQGRKQIRSERDADLARLKGEIAGLTAAVERERGLAQAPQQPQVAPVSDEDGYAENGESAAPAATYDPARLQDLETRLQGAREELDQRAAYWDTASQEAWKSCVEADRQVRQLAGQLAGAERRSPMAGVVTGIYASQGQAVPDHQPVVRVDDPAGYRVVTLVDEGTREPLKAGAVLPVYRPGAANAGKLEKIVQGWDKEVSNFWLWLKPEQPARLQPGQNVEVGIPTASKLVASN
jgi:multidrug efflux pump subunit AcrA (membrane-fusion protein)